MWKKYYIKNEWKNNKKGNKKYKSRRVYRREDNLTHFPYSVSQKCDFYLKGAEMFAKKIFPLSSDVEKYI